MIRFYEDPRHTSENRLPQRARTAVVGVDYRIIVGKNGMVNKKKRKKGDEQGRQIFHTHLLSYFQ